VSTTTPGFSDLDEYGHWAEEAEYGPVWYPEVSVGWVPYRFGHWVWIDPWGWTWVENEPWGFCPFHFGRWVLIGGVWGWLPGPIIPFPVYAPAFVGFLGGFSIGVDLVGWFPLGPFDPFFPWYHYGGDYLRLINITNIRNVTNINNIINVTNINNVHYAYQKVAATAVQKSVFSSGEPVAQHAVRLSPSQLARAQIMPHPAVNPTRQAALPGKPVSPPPVRAERYTLANRPVPSATRAGPAENRPAEPMEKNGPPAENGRRTTPPPAETASTRAPEARPVPRSLITRSAPPPPAVPFVQRRPIMLDHPGRPLEPIQLDDLRAGRPVPPMRDIEFPPHPVPIAPIRPIAPVPARPRISPH
jgi:hypothetical protein